MSNNPFGWFYALYDEQGLVLSHKFVYDEPEVDHPFGYPGRDFDEAYTVTRQPLFDSIFIPASAVAGVDLSSITLPETVTLTVTRSDLELLSALYCNQIDLLESFHDNGTPIEEGSLEWDEFEQTKALGRLLGYSVA